MKQIINLIYAFYHNSFVTSLFSTTVSNLQRELSDCSSALDLGCGPSSPLQYCKGLKSSTGVEAFKPYLEQSKKQRIHTQYLNKNIADLDFPDESFDAVIAIEVLEHLPKKVGEDIIAKAKKWAKKKVIISTPNGFVSQTSLDGNKLQVHLSGWTVAEFSKLGFITKGLSGLKCLRQEVQGNTMGDDLTSSIKYKPKFFWFVIATLSQLITFHFPKLSFELFCVYKKK